MSQKDCEGPEFSHSILVCTDGNPNVIVPTLPPRTRYVAAAAGAYHSVLLRDDGEAVAFGRNTHGEGTVPERPVGTRYIAAAAGDSSTVLLRDDGEAVFLSDMRPGEVRLAQPAVGARFVDVAVGSDPLVLLQDDGRLVDVAKSLDDGNDEDECAKTMVPPCPLGESYVAVAATNNQTIALRSDGVAVAVGLDDHGDGPPTLCGIHVEDLEPIGRPTWLHSFKLPDPTDGGLWTKVAASPGAEHVILISSNGSATAVGWNNSGEGNLPIAPDGLCYISAIVGQQFSVLVRSDRAAVTCGSNGFGQLTIPDGARCVIRQKLPSVVRYGIVIAWVTCHSRFSRVSDAIPHLRRTLLEFIV